MGKMTREASKFRSKGDDKVVFFFLLLLYFTFLLINICCDGCFSFSFGFGIFVAFIIYILLLVQFFYIVLFCSSWEESTCYTTLLLSSFSTFGDKKYKYLHASIMMKFLIYICNSIYLCIFCILSFLFGSCHHTACYLYSY